MSHLDTGTLNLEAEMEGIEVPSVTVVNQPEISVVSIPKTIVKIDMTPLTSLESGEGEECRARRSCGMSAGAGKRRVEAEGNPLRPPLNRSASAQWVSTKPNAPEGASEPPRPPLNRSASAQWNTVHKPTMLRSSDPGAIQCNNNNNSQYNSAEENSKYSNESNESYDSANVSPSNQTPDSKSKFIARTASEMLQTKQQKILLEVSKTVSNHRGYNLEKIQELEKKNKCNSTAKLIGKTSMCFFDLI